MSVEEARGEALPTGLKASGEFGVFVFLVSEGLLFGALILGYIVMRLSPGADFAGASQELSLLLGTLNTCVLLTSSLAAALATMWADGGWTPQEVADHFHEVLGQHLQPVGMGDHPLLGKKG